MAGDRPILVALKDTPASVRGLEVALGLASATKKTSVRAVHVIVVDRRLALDAPLPDQERAAEALLERAEQLGKKRQIPLAGEILQAREAGHAIADEAAALGARAIVLGLPARRASNGPAELGKTAEYVMRHATCEVLLVRHEMGA